tara:strand:+ start:329 stop:553 length:225 start_codon:yes stop_codon:yes gene_type:complete
MEFHGVTDHSNLLRDPSTNSILNVDEFGYQQYVSKRKAKEEKNQKVQTLEQEVASMKSDISEIKNLLREFLNGS